MAHGILYNHENLLSLPWQLQAQIPQESDTSVHNGVHHALPTHKSCLLVLQPVKTIARKLKDGIYYAGSTKCSMTNF